jgi:CBS domain-containing protein
MKDLKAKDVMTKNVLTVGEDWLIDQLAEFLIEHGISGAPVLSVEGKLIGVVSVTDIARFTSHPVRERQTEDPHDYYLEADLALAREELSSFNFTMGDLVSVRDIMTPAIFSVGVDESVARVADTMVRGRVHRVFVTNEKQIVGIISTLDLLKLVAAREN